MLGKKLGFDLGTINTLIWEAGQIVLQEPSLVAIQIEDEARGLIKAIETGQPVREMLGKVDSEDIQIIRPVQNGVIADFEVTVQMMEYYLGKVTGRLRLFKPTAMMSVPYGANSVERRAVYEAAGAAGVREVLTIPAPLAAAIGAGLPIATPAGDMIVTIGGGITEAAVLSMSAIVRAESGRVGGLRLDEAIISYVRRKYQLNIGQPTAEAVKIQVGAAVPVPNPMTMDIQGRDARTGLPRAERITTNEVVEALSDTLGQIAQVVKNVLSATPPELASDIIDRGIVLTGGVALLRGIDQYLTMQTSVPVYKAENPQIAVATGAGRALEDSSLQRRIVQS